MPVARETRPAVIVAVPVPVSLDDDDASGVHAVAALERAVQDARWGHHDLAYSARENLAGLHDARYTRRFQLVATSLDRPGEALGAAFLRLPQVGNTHRAELEILVHPDHVGTGADDALVAAAERYAAQQGRRVVGLETEHVGEPAADASDAVVAPTGSGRVSRSDAAAALALRSGFGLEQAIRYSVLPLPVAAPVLVALRSAAIDAAGDDYRTVTWAEHCPQEWVEQFADLEARMSTDAPSAGLDTVADPWNAARVRAAEDAVRRSGRGRLATAIEHRPTRTLAGVTVVDFPLDRPEVVFQHDTLVLREHRGHRLGLLAKVVNLEALAGRRPQARRVHTWNAEENSFMLAINVALGFEPRGVIASWQKHLSSQE